MYELLALFSGVLLAGMIQMDGGLGARFGVYHGTLYIHIVGVLFAALVLLLRRKPLGLRRGIPAWMYLGGVIGVATTVCSNLAFTHLSLTSILALELFAQLALSCLIDRFGWLGMARQKELDMSGVGMLLSLAGIALMLRGGGSSPVYVLLALAAGATVVLSRVVNAHLSRRIGELQGSFINHLAGLPVCLLLVALIPEQGSPGPYPLWVWGGGVLGVFVVLLCNVTVPRLPASRVTLLSFCGQMFCGILLDLLLSGSVDKTEFAAGLLVAAGVAASQGTKLLRQRREKRRTAYFAHIARAEQAHREQILRRSAH